MNNLHIIPFLRRNMPANNVSPPRRLSLVLCTQYMGIIRPADILISMAKHEQRKTQEENTGLRRTCKGSSMYSSIHHHCLWICHSSNFPFYSSSLGAYPHSSSYWPSPRSLPLFHIYRVVPILPALHGLAIGRALHTSLHTSYLL